MELSRLDNAAKIIGTDMICGNVEIRFMVALYHMRKYRVSKLTDIY